MNGPEHYREGERLLTEAAHLVMGGASARLERADRDEPCHPEPLAMLAQAHFAAAQAAAIGTYGAVRPDGAARRCSDDEAWWEVAGKTPQGGPSAPQSAETGTPVGTDTPDPAEAVSACCGGSGFADYAAVPCPNPQCTATPPRSRRLAAVGPAIVVVGAAVAWRREYVTAQNPFLLPRERTLIEAVDAYLAATGEVAE